MEGRVAEDSAPSHGVAVAGFPARLSGDTEQVMGLLGKGLLPGIAGDMVVVEGEQLVLPGRVYVDLPSASLFSSESPVERLITSCVLSRHHDGIVRQEQVRNLISCQESWAIPYVLALVGESVIEIHQEIADHLPSALHQDERKRDAYARVLVSNPEWWLLLQQRVISYWAVYYRFDYPMVGPKRRLPVDYPAAQVIRGLSSTSNELTLLRPLTHLG